MRIEEAKTKKLEKKLELTGYAIGKLSLLVNEVLFRYENSNEESEEFPTVLPKELVENSNSTVVNSFLVENGFINEKEEVYEITEKTLKIFDLVLESEIRL